MVAELTPSSPNSRSVDAPSNYYIRPTFPYTIFTYPIINPSKTIHLPRSREAASGAKRDRQRGRH